MALTVTTAAYGRPSAEALREAVVTGKGGDPLAPVTVVVPTNYVGVAARRLLASGELGRLTEAGHGIAGVTFLTVYRLAELLGAPRLARDGRRPVSSAVLAAALRGVLAEAPGIFASVADHPATEAALVGAYRDLSACTPESLAQLASAGRRAAHVVRICSRARARLAASWYDERDLMDAAATEIGTGSPALAGIGTVVLYLPQDLSVPAASLVRSLASHTTVTAVVGVSGVARADATTSRAVARLSAEPGVGTPVGVPHGTHVVSASDADDEVRAAVRLVVDALRDGVPLERMAILYGAAEPYARLVHEQLTAAAILHNGAAVRTLADSVLGRGLLGLLALPDRDFHRHDVMGLLASAPVHHRGRPVPAAQWERISRAAGVVRGPAEWHDRLARHATILERSLAEERSVPDREPQPERYERQLAATRELQAFLADVAGALTVDPATSWSGLAAWGRQLVAAHLAPESRRRAWPEAERLAADKVEAALERLAGLDAVESAPGVDVFRRTLELELDADLGRVGRLGDGILMGHVALGLGLDLDRVFICGLAEGTFPARVHDDSLLAAADRRATGGVLPLRAERVDDDHRALLAALAGASDARVLLFPRGDLRRTTERMPSRFVLDTVRALAGESRRADDLDRLRADWYTPVPSFAAGIGRVTFPATEQEHRLRALSDHTRHGRPVREHEVVQRDVALSRGVEASLARASADFTRFDGNLAGLPLPGPSDLGVVVSPTRLQTYAACPFAYLLEHVLGVEVPELPEARYELAALDRGNLVHETLEQFLREALQRPTGPAASGAPPGVQWSDDDRTRLHTIAEAHCAAYEAQGLTGRAVFWHRDRRRVLADLDRFLTEDDRVRGAYGLRPVATELRFGFATDSGPPVEVVLSDGRSLRFRGAADRVDRTTRGELWVIDYKTGRPWGLDPDDPTAAGTLLQLPVYAHAARAAFAEAGADNDITVGASYWYISTRGGFRWAELVLTPAVDERVDEVLRAIADGIEAGAFPCRVDPPSTWNPRVRSYVDPDARGTRDRHREWSRKRHAPELAGYVALAEPTAANHAGPDDG